MKEFVEKLIGRLEEVSIPIYDEDVKAEGEVIYTDIAINTINELTEEYNNDVCEWTEYDYKTIRSPHERNWSIPSMKDFKYCPYCGKKIKVVK